ncbi:hypothetical protein C3486_13225 [Streptomyces sp. Ru73]|uniref:DUF6578 domain-containing protein n=1 Tax=Streptomyces sp. Ru73 TaxID=2080748 RepID=UPI000CDE080D|nr:DUF6578 domain-containing protein [Streptomyces sp. Ru73]POX40595.1 hypothetical protein C3486_13225 [Streptomyces sp. Ru73]
MSVPEPASATPVPAPDTADDARTDDARTDDARAEDARTDDARAGEAGGEVRGEVRRVFYEDWEMECCGTPFSVGDRVTWNVDPARDPMWDWRVNNHGDAPGGPSSVTGLVRSVRIVTEGYRRPAGSHTYEQVPGERGLHPVRTCPKWFAERPDDGTRRRPDHYLRESGALVELEVAVPPPGESATTTATEQRAGARRKRTSARRRRGAARRR